MRNTGSASTTRSIGSTLLIGRGRLNWHAALPSRREFAFDAANVFDDARTVSHNYTPGHRPELSMPGSYQARVLQTVIETLGGWGHFAQFALYNGAPMRGVADI